MYQHETALWAAMWWAEQLRIGRPGSGLGERQAEEAMGLIGVLVQTTHPEPTKEQLAKFEEVLTRHFDEELRTKGKVDLYRDYDTPPMILEAMDIVGIDRMWDRKFPHKTGMKISRGSVMLKAGYGVHYQEVYP